MNGERAALSARQMMCLLIAMRLEVATIILPVVSSVDNPKDAWVTALLGVAAAIPMGLLVTALAHRFPGLTIVQFSRKLLGWPVGTVVSGIYLLFFLHIVAAVGGVVALAYNAAAMPETPWLFFAATVIALGAVAAACGIEVLGRAAEVACLVALPLFAATLLLPLNQMHAANLMPVLASGLGPAALNSLIAIGLFGEVIVAWMLIPYLDRPQQARAHIVAYILVSGAVLVGAALAVVAVFGPTANALLLPVYSLGRITMIADIVERVEMIPLGIWTLVSWLKVGLFLWIISVGVGQLVGLRDHRPLIWPLGLLALAFTGVLHKDVFGVVRFFRWEVLGVYACSVQALLLGALWAAALIRGKDQRGGPGKGRTTARDGRGGRRRPPAKVPPDGEPDHSPPGGHVMGGEGL